MSGAATSKRRPSADPLSLLVSQRERSEGDEPRRDWTRPTLAATVSLLAHGVLFVVLASLYVSRRGTEYAEVVPIEANLNVPVNLFDTATAEIETNVALASPLAVDNDQADAPAKLETPSEERENFTGVDAGARPLDLSGKGAPAKVGEGLGSGSPGAGDAGQRAELPGGLSAVGRRIVFVIDRSASMNKPSNNPAIAWAREELIRCIKRMQPNMSFQVVFYSDTVMTLPNPDRRKDLIPATEFAKERAIQFISDLDAEGGTNHRIGLEKGFELKPDVLFFMTDADDDTDDDLRRLNNWATAQNHRKSEQHGPASIHMIQLWHRNDLPSGVVRELAQRNNGSYRLIRATELGKRTAP